MPVASLCHGFDEDENPEKERDFVTFVAIACSSTSLYPSSFSGTQGWKDACDCFFYSLPLYYACTPKWNIYIYFCLPFIQRIVWEAKQWKLLPYHLESHSVTNFPAKVWVRDWMERKPSSWTKVFISFSFCLPVFHSIPPFSSRFSTQWNKNEFFFLFKLKKPKRDSPDHCHVHGTRYANFSARVSVSPNAVSGWNVKLALNNEHFP